MKNAIIIHGKANHTKYFDSQFNSPSNSSWLPWLQKQLLLNDILAQTPEMPEPWKPDYSAWSLEFERYNLTAETILVGHSCGAGFIVRWLSEHTDIRVGKVVLVAPWLDPDRTGDTGAFFDFTIEPSLSEQISKLTVYSSSNDFHGAIISAKIIIEAIPAAVSRQFTDYGHFVHDTEVPELLKDLLA